MDSKPAEIAQYYELLDELVAECHALVDGGQAYAAVLLGHELFRYLYPVEPFAGFEHEEPVDFCIGHVRRLLTASRTLRDAVSPYASPFSNGANAAPPPPLEIATSDLYSDLWRGFSQEELTAESVQLIERRLTPPVVSKYVTGKRVLDMGCGSGRYSLALAKLGAAHVEAVDVQSKAFAAAKQTAGRLGLPVTFREGSVHQLPFDSGSFDFVFCNGVLHHTSSIERGLAELSRVLDPRGRAFVYLYGAGGIFWGTRRALRSVFARIPLDYTKAMLGLMGMPSKRFIFCDTWYVPIEMHTTTPQLHDMLQGAGLFYEKLPGRNAFDLDRSDLQSTSGYEAMWGNGEHRYLLAKSPAELAS